MTSQITTEAPLQLRPPTWKDSMDSITANLPNYRDFRNRSNISSERRRSSGSPGTATAFTGVLPKACPWQTRRLTGEDVILAESRDIQAQEGKTHIPAHVRQVIAHDKPPISFSYSPGEIDVRPLKTGISAFCGTSQGDTHATQSIVQWPLEIVDVRRDPCKYPMRKFKLKDETDGASSKSEAVSKSTAASRRPVKVRKEKNIVMDALYPGMPANEDVYDAIRTPSVRQAIETKRNILDYVSLGWKAEDIPVAPRVRAMQEVKVIKPPRKETPDWQLWYDKHTGQAECGPPVIPPPLPVYVQIEFSIKSRFVEDSMKRRGGLSKHNEALETIRFGIPCDLRDLVDTTPLAYLARFAKLKPVKMNKYADIFRQFMTKNQNDPILQPVTNQRVELKILPEALNDVLNNNIKPEDWVVVNKKILHYSRETINMGVTFKEFSGLCAFCERIAWSAAVRKSDNLPRRPMLEDLDFQLLKKRSLEFGLSHPLMTVVLSL